MPVKAEPTVPAVPLPSVPPKRIADTTKVPDPLSSVITSVLDPSVAVTVASSFTESVSLTATKLVPVTVITISAVSVLSPSVIV